MSERVEFVVGEGREGRLDTVVAAGTGITRALAARLIERGEVLVDGRRAAKSTRVGAGASIEALLPAEPGPPVPEDIPLRVVYEDDAMMVISKPAGLVVHPAPGHPGGTLVNALLARAGKPAGGDEARPGIVHRLDAGTSGLMIVAKDAGAYGSLVAAMAAREITRVYLALVEGEPGTDTTTIDAPIGRSQRQRKKMAVVASGREARTGMRVLERFGVASLVEARPETGRTHQIRVHLAAIDHAVVGDAVYGRDRSLARALGLDRPFLHAARLSFHHPVSGAPLELADPLPADLEAALARVRLTS